MGRVEVDQSRRLIVRIALAVMTVLTLSTLSFGADKKTSPVVTIVGYVRDTGCVHRYPEVTKPLPNGCLEACVRSGSALVILSRSGQVYHPLSTKDPDADVRPILLPFAGKLVRVSGQLYKRGGSTAIALDHIEALKE